MDLRLWIEACEHSWRAAGEQQSVLDPQLVEALLRHLAAEEREAALAGLRSLARAAGKRVTSGQLKRLAREIGA